MPLPEHHVHCISDAPAAPHRRPTTIAQFNGAHPQVQLLDVPQDGLLPCPAHGLAQ